MRLYIALVALLADLSFAHNANATVAKAYPRSPAYPKLAEWDSLKATVGGRLFKCPMMGANADACGAPSLLSDYVLLASSPSDVAEGLKFATGHNLRVTVRNTGHDFMARHSGVGAFTIVTQGLKSSVYKESWTPTAGSARFKADQSGRKQNAVVVEAGTIFWELLKDLQPKNMAVAHGADGSVGAAAGWILGGGHGPFSNKFGLGCDNVLEFEVVLTNGSIVIANEDSYTDLFWALRGGGGGTFGIVTKTTMKTFPVPDSIPLALNIRAGDTGRAGFLDALAYMFAITNNFTDFGMTGYPVVTNSSYLAALTAPDRTSTEIAQFINPILDKLRSYGVTAYGMTGPTEMGYWSPLLGLAIGHEKRTVPDPLADIHREQNKWREAVNQAHSLDRRQVVDMKPLNQLPLGSMASRLLDRNKLNEANFPEIRKMVGGLKGYLLPYPNAGGKVTKNRHLDIGLNPAWRDAGMHLIAVSYDRPGNVAAMDPLSVNHGAYINEAFEFEKDWQTTFFGPKEHYARLLAVKRKYDPTNTLWCFPCVGGDVFVEQKGKLYMRDTSESARLTSDEDD